MPIVNIIPTPVRVILKHRAQRRKGLYLFYYNYTLYGEEAQDRRLGVGEVSASATVGLPHGSRSPRTQPATQTG